MEEKEVVDMTECMPNLAPDSQVTRSTFDNEAIRKLLGQTPGSVVRKVTKAALNKLRNKPLGKRKLTPDEVSRAQGPPLIPPNPRLGLPLVCPLLDPLQMKHIYLQCTVDNMALATESVGLGGRLQRLTESSSFCPRTRISMSPHASSRPPPSSCPATRKTTPFPT